MNNIRGGAYSYVCWAFLADGTQKMYIVTADSLLEATDIVHAETGASQVNYTTE